MKYFFENNDRLFDTAAQTRDEVCELVLCMEHSRDKERRRKSRERKLSESRQHWLERGA